MADLEQDILGAIQQQGDSLRSLARSSAEMSTGITKLLERQAGGGSGGGAGNMAVTVAMFAVNVTMIAAVAMSLSQGVTSAVKSSDEKVAQIYVNLNTERDDRISGDTANETASDKRHETATRDLDQARASLAAQEASSRTELQAQIERIERIIDVIAEEAFEGLGRNGSTNGKP